MTRRLNRRALDAPSARRSAVALSLALTALASRPGGALAVPAPDAARLAALQAEFGSHARLRLRAAGESLLLNECRLDSAGVRGLRGIDPAGAISAPRREAYGIPWAGIDDLARCRSRAGRGVRWGAAIAVAGGIAIAGALPTNRLGSSVPITSA